MNSLYFLSAAANDRVLNLWQFDKKQISDSNDKTTNNTSHLSFILNDNPLYIDLEKILDEEKVRNKFPSSFNFKTKILFLAIESLCGYRKG